MIEPVYDKQGVTIYHGDSVEVMRTLPENSVDSIVTDPPYGIRFMGKAWDGVDIEKQTETRRKYGDGPSPTGGHNSVAANAGQSNTSLSSNQAFAEWTRVWAVEALRILKPGGHMLVFCGPRTYHRMVSGVEDAGFEIRDQIMWLYGSGFPKSHDISKAIDKRNGRFYDKGFQDYCNEKRIEKGYTHIDINTKMGLATSGGGFSSCIMGDKIQNELPTKEMYLKLKVILELDDRFDELIDKIEAERKKIGEKESGCFNKDERGRHTIGASESQTVDITAPATPEAAVWDGWGTALKPAHEPIVVARKPFTGTVAENVLKHGTGGINIDGGRIGTEGGTKKTDPAKNPSVSAYGDGLNGGGCEEIDKGRFPANIILDPEAAAMLDEQSGDSVSVNNPRNNNNDDSDVFGKYNACVSHGHNDSGGASRFFYCAKASKQDRDEGLEGMAESRHSAMGYERGLGDNGEGMFKDRNPLKRNSHPTVKPTSLMQYLVRLVTPPGGTTYDPFMGSGSTGKAAVREGFKFIGSEREAENIPISIARINAPAQVELL